MNDAQRQRGFILSAAVIVAASLLVWLAAARGAHRHHAVAGSAKSHSVTGRAQAVDAHRALLFGGEATGTQDDPAPPAGRAGPVTVAGNFARAFAQYEAGHLSRAVRRGLEATATPAFARELVSAPPRGAIGAPVPPAASVVSASLSGAPTATGAVAVAELAQDGTSRNLTLLLVRSGGGWRVSNLG